MMYQGIFDTDFDKYCEERLWDPLRQDGRPGGL